MNPRGWCSSANRCSFGRSHFSDRLQQSEPMPQKSATSPNIAGKRSQQWLERACVRPGVASPRLSWIRFRSSSRCLQAYRLARRRGVVMAARWTSCRLGDSFREHCRSRVYEGARGNEGAGRRNRLTDREGRSVTRFRGTTSARSTLLSRLRADSVRQEGAPTGLCVRSPPMLKQCRLSCALERLEDSAGRRASVKWRCLSAKACYIELHDVLAEGAVLGRKTAPNSPLPRTPCGP